VLAFLRSRARAARKFLLSRSGIRRRRLTESTTVPSFLYLPDEAIAAQIRGHGPGSGAWVVGRLAQRKASDTPRARRPVREVLAVSSRRRPLGPIPAMGIRCAGAAGQISPLTRRRLFSLIFAQHGTPGSQARLRLRIRRQDSYDHRSASFDAAAQRLTLAAAQQAGFPDHCMSARGSRRRRSTGGWSTRLARSDPWSALPNPQTAAAPCFGDRRRGGTSDFSLFELSRHGAAVIPGSAGRRQRPHPARGDNIDSRSRIC